MINWLPLRYSACRHLLRRLPPRLIERADSSWEIHPATKHTLPPAYFLPGQLDRIMGWETPLMHPIGALGEHVEVMQRPTRAFELSDIALIDGALYKGGAYASFRRRRRRWLPQLSTKVEVDEAALYCSRDGVTWFGQWLLADCPTYLMAREMGTPATLADPRSAHRLDYERRLGMSSEYYASAFFRKLIVFDDQPQNPHRSARYREVQRRIVGDRPVKRHPGVFLLRGQGGSRRILLNELEIAERLEKRRGFRVLDPLAHDVETILTICAGARVIAGVEGSHLIHGALTMGEGDAFLILQPPTRFMLVFKEVADRDNLHFGFVVGTPEGFDFRVDPDEVERTLDLMPLA